MTTNESVARRLGTALALIAALATSAVAQAADAPYPGTITVASPHGFADTAKRVEQAVAANKMGLVAKASASAGAAARGVKIAGNIVLMVFRNDYAVRMLAASVPAGIEAPIRIYVTEDGAGKTAITWRTPSAVFAPYGNAALDAMARELDPVFDKIVRDAVGN
ncbi:MAG TPA: hypothetical protein DHV08_08955 [Rhodocyclaceae bacterium]|nr:MAG: hypothetical protein AUK49_01060 [Betaproteobacteria bacterium CG2_30_68_42]PIV76507.1 MAG: hypothetical protein COW56_01390 [Rhodocyclales bacterium CG17_big_fil_post_rev_8_21_14_2_50_68_7]PIX74240.1 MAG: hypothetical protein COZ38_11225 [Rhodocyclales bacterium CG_4_10_14_3_um_filter_68_10]PJA56162.1 MAG: hypothetical protein CO164_14530 [Rhodocyclales bacterium CG_4_9_14_3_um_filter_68_10]HCX33671.1 hypothetical protein [Rhodocyclaceae bacterium]